MGEDFCEPSGMGLLLYGLLFALLGGGAGWLVGGLLPRRPDTPDDNWPRRFAVGCLVPAVVGGVVLRLLARLLYSGCEAAAWGLAPGGAVLLIVVLPVAGLAAFLASRARPRS